MISEIIYALIAFFVENATGVALVKNFSDQEQETRQLIEVHIEETLHEFRRFDQNDAVFREYDPPSGEEADPHAWKKNMPQLKKSIWNAIQTVLIIQTVCGLFVGLLATLVVWFQMNTIFLCFIQHFHVPRAVFAIKIIGHAIEGFLMQMYHNFILLTVFSWTQLNKLYILYINIAVGLTNVLYELILCLYGFVGNGWHNFPLYLLFVILTFSNSTILGRYCRPWPYKWTKTMALSITFSAQNIFLLSLIVVYCHIFWPWYNKQNESTKVFTAAMSPLITFLPKLICRLAAQKLRDVHPGNAHVFVSCLYGTNAIVFRSMQAELSSIGSFILLGILHGFIDCLERLTATMRDHIWECLYRLIRHKRKQKSHYRSPRKRRFVADMSIQILLQETTGLVVSLGIFSLYRLIYSNTMPPYTDYTVIKDFFVRVFTGLAIDLVFSTISVVIQTRHMNIAIMKVWTKKWRHHCLVLLIITIETMIFFTGYLLNIIRFKYDNETEDLVQHNCTMPFSGL